MRSFAFWCQSAMWTLQYCHDGPVKLKKTFIYFSDRVFLTDKLSACRLCLLFQNRLHLYETLFYEMNAEILDLPCISNTALIDISHNVVHRSGTVKAR